MREKNGAFKTRSDTNGTEYHLHRLANGQWTPAAAPSSSSGTTAERAAVDTCSEVYHALLARLKLAPAHREALRGRGLTDDAIDRADYRTLPVQGRARIAGELFDLFGDKLLSVPGFIVKEAQNGPYVTVSGAAGLIVPCRDVEGRIIALKLRPDDNNYGGKYQYLSSKKAGGPGPGAPAHVPAGTPTSSVIVRLAEGELKADVAFVLSGIVTISVAGATNWHPALEFLKTLGAKIVRLAFDADAWINPAVARALAACADALIRAGFAVELERWDLSDGKGIDDLLAAGKDPTLLQGDAAHQAIQEAAAGATASDTSGEVDIGARMQEVLAAGGAEALFRDRELLKAVAALKARDAVGYAAVRALVSRHEISLRVFDRAVTQLGQEANNDQDAHYFESLGATWRRAMTPNGPAAHRLAEFTARIVEEVVHDDGVQKTRLFGLEGKLSDGTPLPRVDIPAEVFGRMEWVASAWGARALVHAGRGTADHLRAAIQFLSGEVPQRAVFAHTGWRKVGDEWLYLHGGGAIGATGAVDVGVSLPEPLARFRLPAPPDGEALRDAVRASLRLLELGHDRLTFAVFGALYRAVLSDTDFGVHLVGPTGCYKSELAALIQQHLGKEMDARHLPASWLSTGNALEGLAFAAKDSVLTVDDFAPSGSATEVQRAHREADRLFRGQGNRSGRGRMRADTSLRPEKPPRGLLLSTGEDTPRGQSLRARMLVLEVSYGDLGPKPPESNPRLTACQRDAADGKYAAAMSGFLRWFAARYEAVRARLQDEYAALREQACSAGQHARTPGIIADLSLGLRYFLEFAVSVGAIDANEQAYGIETGPDGVSVPRWNRAWKALTEAGAGQAAAIADAEPAAIFLRLIRAALASGRAHLVAPGGGQPPEAESWGWRRGPQDHLEAQGRSIGWVDDDFLYLEPDAAFAEANVLAGQQSHTLPVSPKTLWSRLKERGYLAAWDSTRQRNTVRRKLGGKRDREVLAIRLDALLGADATIASEQAGDQAADTIQEADEADENGRSDRPNGRSKDTHRPEKNGQKHEGNGLNGRSGRSRTGGDGSANENQHEWGGWQ